MRGKKKKLFATRSIYLPESDSEIDKEVNKLAKKDKNIPIEIRNKRSSLVSFVTIALWKRYIYDQLHKEDNK